MTTILAAVDASPAAQPVLDTATDAIVAGLTDAGVVPVILLPRPA